MKNYLRVEDLEVYIKLCQLHIEICEMSRKWPQEEKYELGSQVRRSSNSAPAQLAEKLNPLLFITSSTLIVFHLVLGELTASFSHKSLGRLAFTPHRFSLLQKCLYPFLSIFRAA